MAMLESLPSVNLSNLEKIESFLNDPAYREALESSANYNTRLCIERRLRMPFLDSQTGVAQNHSQLFMAKRQRIPGLLPGQIYSYPRARWRKKRRQYLLFQSRSFARATDSMLDGDGDLHNISQVENPALQDTDSKDSQLLKDEVSKDWFYDEQDMLEMEGYDEPDADSDFDYEESYSKRKRSKKNAGKGRGIDSPSTPRRGKGGGRGRKKTIHSFEPMPGDPDKPFGCELCGARYKTRPGLTYHYSHSHRDGASDDSRDSVAAGVGPAVATNGSGPPMMGGIMGGAIGTTTTSNAGLMGGGGIMAAASGGVIGQPLAAGGVPPPLLGGPTGGVLGVAGVVGGPDLTAQGGPPPPAQHNVGTQGHVYQDSYVTFLNHPAGTPGRRGRQPASANNPPPQPPPQQAPPQPPLPTPPSLPLNPPPPIPSAPDDPPMPILTPEKKINKSNENSNSPTASTSEPSKDKAAPSPYCDFCLGDARENRKTGTSEELVSCSDCGRSGKARLELEKNTTIIPTPTPGKKGRKKKNI